MPKYPKVHLDEFKRLLKVANPGIGLNAKVFGKSSIQPLMAILDDDAGNAQKVATAITTVANTADGTYGNKANKYKEALYYLQRTYPVPTGSIVGVKANQAKAVKLHRSGREPSVKTWRKYEEDNARSWQPVADGGIELATASRIEALAGTVEEYILSQPLNTGVVVIHLQGYQTGMNRVYDGWKAVDHMRSVLRVAAAAHMPLCTLKVQGGESVCPELQLPRDLFGEQIAPYVARHSGFHSDEYRDFVTSKENIILMGFDADVCVHINMFGGPELMDATDEEKRTNKPSRTVSGILSHCNVITSRPMLVARGLEAIDRDEFGPQLHGT
jgi:hypothetical protein